MKKILISILTLALLVPSTAFAGDNTNRDFSDLSSDHPQYNYIQWLARSGVIQGYPDGSFQAANCVQRVEFLKMLLEARSIELDASVDNPFPDVDMNQWYGPYVLEAFERGIIQGYADGTFQPDACVSKPEVLKMTMVEYIGDDFQAATEGPELLNGVTDNTWFYKYFDYALPRNLVVYEEDFTVNQPISFQGGTRGDVAETLYRFVARETNDADIFESNMQPRELYTRYQGIDEMLDFFFPTQWDITEDFFYETAAGVKSEMATIELSFAFDPSVKITINERMVSCGTEEYQATCLETEAGYTISSINPSQATLSAMKKIQQTLTFESPEPNIKQRNLFENDLKFNFSFEFDASIQVAGKGGVDKGQGSERYEVKLELPNQNIIRIIAPIREIGYENTTTFDIEPINVKGFKNTFYTGRQSNDGDDKYWHYGFQSEENTDFFTGGIEFWLEGEESDLPYLEEIISTLKYKEFK